MVKKFSLNEKEKNFALQLARESIEYYLRYNTIKWVDEDVVPKKFKENKACFVTLTINGKLRGCIGHLKAIQFLFQDINENAVSAAFNDPRFPPLSKEEFERIKIEVSVLTDPVPLKYKTVNELLKKICPYKHGLIIQKGYNSATFLPSVWKELNEKERFLSHLCLKANLSPEEWKEGTLKVFNYEAIKIKE